MAEPTKLRLQECFGKDSIYILWIGTHAEYDRLNVKEL